MWDLVSTIANEFQAEDKSSLPPRSVQTEQEILLLYEVTAAHGSSQDFQKLLSSPIFSPLEQLKQGRKEPLIFAARKLHREESWPALFTVCRDCLAVENDNGEPTMQASDWETWRLFILAASHTQDTDTEATSAVQDLLLKLSKAASSRPTYKRNVMLARVSASFRLMESEGQDAVDSSPASLRLRELTKYINDQAANPSCFNDVRPYVEQLDATGVEYLANTHFMSDGQGDDLPEIRKQLLGLKLQYFASTCPQTYVGLSTDTERGDARDSRLKNAYKSTMALHKHISTIPSYSEQPTKDLQSDVAVLAAFCLVELSDQLPSSIPTAQAGQYLVQALLLLQQQLNSSPKHSQIALLLLQLHLRLGSAQEGLRVWGILEIKRTIMDSLAPLLYDRLSTIAPNLLSPDTDAGWQLIAAIKSHYDNSLKMRMPRRLIDAFQNGSYSSVLSVPEYIENLRASCTRAMSLVESVRAERLLGAIETDVMTDPRFTEIQDDTEMNDLIDYGSFPSWNHSAMPPIYKRLRLGPGPSNRRTHLSLLAEAFHETLGYTAPTFYKVPLSGSVTDQTYVLERLGQIANSLSKFLPGAASDFTESEQQYFETISLLSSLVPLCAERAAGLGELMGQFASAITASLDSQRSYITALAEGATIGSTTSLLQSLHRIVLLRDTAIAVKGASQWILSYNEKQKERDRSGQSNLPKDVVAQTKSLGTAADEALKQCKTWIMRLTADTKSGGVVERGIKKLAYGGEEGKLLQGFVTDSTVFDLVGSWRKSMAGWQGVKWQ